MELHLVTRMALPAMALCNVHSSLQSCRSPTLQGKGIVQGWLVEKSPRLQDTLGPASTTCVDLQAREACEDASNAQLTVVLLRQERDSLLQRLAKLEDKVIASEGIFPVRETAI